MFVAMKRRLVGLAVWVLGCGGSHTSAQSPSEAPAATSASAASSAIPTAPSAPAAAPTAAPTASIAPALANKSNDMPAVAIATAKAHTEGQHYVLDAKAPANVSVGGNGELEIVLLAKDGYHINDEFPYKLRTAVEPVGAVTFEKPELTRTQGTYTKIEARFKARFSGAKTGEAKIGGVMALSVCTTKECVTDKIELQVPVTVR
jgi:hypothetical protein